MATGILSEFNKVLSEAFEMDYGRDWHGVRGVKALVLSGHLFRMTPPTEIVAMMRDVLPSDTRLMDGLDGMIGRTSGIADRLFVYITSESYPLIEEGASFQPVEPVLYLDHPFDAINPENERPTQIHSLCRSHLDTHEFTINKHTHSFEIPRDRETEDEIVIVVRPKS